MTVDVGQVVDEEVEYALDGTERAELEAVAERLTTMASGKVDDLEWLDAARDLSCLLPVGLRQRLRKFTQDSGPDAMLLLRNLPVGQESLPETPTVRGSVQREATIGAATEVLIAHQMGEVVAFREEKSGAIVQDVVPVPGMEEFQGNAGSTELTMHVENAFHVNRPDFVGLLCLRNDHDEIAGLQIGSIRRAAPLLSPETLEILHQPRFVTEAPASFGMDNSAVEPHGILFGSVEDPDIKVDFTSTTPLDPDAREAMAELGQALAKVRHTLYLKPGDLAFADNRLALHGRTHFTPRYDGQDRWLQRVFVHLNHRLSRGLRSGQSHILSSS